MADKVTFANKAQNTATKLAQAIDAANNLETVYFDRGYNVGGANPIVDLDVIGLGITAGTLGGLITLIQQLRNFVDNAAVATGDYDSTLNKMRTDV